MKQKLLFLPIIILLCTILPSCHNNNSNTTSSKANTSNPPTIMQSYWEERMQLFPLEATANGDNRYNDRLTITISQPFRDSTARFYNKYLTQLNGIDSTSLNKEDLLSYRLLRYELQMGLEGLKYPTHLLPINQFWGMSLDLPLLGSGSGNQPFKTTKDYDDFLKRMSVFPAWTDTAISNMRKGIATGWVLPKALVEKILPQLKAIAEYKAVDSSIFYGPIKSFPDSLSTNKDRLTTAYRQMIETVVKPSYTKLYAFFQTEYLPKARTTSGVSSLPQGKEYYQYMARYWTTTDITPDSIYNLGLTEVARIEREMIAVMNEDNPFNEYLRTIEIPLRVKDSGKYSYDTAYLHQIYFSYINTSPQFFPFKTPQAVLDSFWAIKKAEEPQLKRLFNHTPKTAFTIRQTEAFRAASASAEYNPPSEDGSRPGIFYVPILDATKYNAVGMETLFLHEAIPGHHYQIALQQENKDLPKFRRFLWYGAYGEGWALYSESLGKELGVYTNPYQYFGHLSDEMHRAIRLVVDVGMHWKGMTREQAIEYMLQHEGGTREGATAEIERYMAIPGQALSYKMGQLFIRAQRTKYEQQFGTKFNIAAFHDQVLGGGCVPLNILAENLETWAKAQH